jgi:hypothetical protein
MKCLPMSIVIGLLSAMSGIANAATIASPPMFTIGIPDADQAACYVRNVGTRAVQVNVRFTGVLTLTFDNCNSGPLAPGRTCVIVQGGPLAFAECVVISSVSSKHLRGTVELRRATPDGLRVLNAQDLQ